MPVTKLAKEWVEGALIVYVGQSGGNSKRTLKKRIGELIQFGKGARVGHWGGRFIWQLAQADELLICWNETVDDDPKQFKKELIEAFRLTYSGRC